MSKRNLVLALAVLATVVGSSSALADAITFKVSNKSGMAINTLSAVPKAGGASINLIASAIAAGATSPVTFTAPANTCVFALTTTLASGRVIANPDTDLCQTDLLVVQ